MGSGVLETLLIGLVLGDGDCLPWGDAEAPLRTGEGLRSEEPEAVVRANAVCLVVVSGPPGWIGLGKTLSYVLKIRRASVSW